MNRQEEYEDHRAYIESEGLDKLIDWQENIDYEMKPTDTVSGELNIPFPAEPADLVRLHKLIRKRKCFTVLEFGLGYSTIIMADALQKNQEDWNQLRQKPEIRNRFMFQLFSLEASQTWVENLKLRFPSQLIDRVRFQLSDVEIGAFNG